MHAPVSTVHQYREQVGKRIVRLATRLLNKTERRCSKTTARAWTARRLLYRPQAGRKNMNTVDSKTARPLTDGQCLNDVYTLPPSLLLAPIINL